MNPLFMHSMPLGIKRHEYLSRNRKTNSIGTKMHFKMMKTAQSGAMKRIIWANLSGNTIGLIGLLTRMN